VVDGMMGQMSRMMMRQLMGHHRLGGYRRDHLRVNFLLTINLVDYNANRVPLFIPGTARF